MWAKRLVAPAALETIEVAAPREADLCPGEVLIDIEAGAICGSDVPKFCNGPAGVQGSSDSVGELGYPLHEITGVVRASADTRHPIGARVVGWARRSNGLAERVVTGGADVIAYDRRLDPVDAVILQPLACVLEALGRVDVRDRDVAVLGLGPIGLLFAHAAQDAGAASVVGVDPVDRADVAERFGLDHVFVAPSSAWQTTVDEGPEVCIEAVGHQTATLNHAVRSTRPGGTILYFGIPDEDVYPIDMEAMVRRHLTLVAGVTRHRRQALRAACDYAIRHPELHALLRTDVLPPSEAAAAFDLAGRPVIGQLKIVIDYRL